MTSPQPTRVFTPDKSHILATIVMTLGALLAISWAPLILGWLLIFPALFIYWVLTAKTTVGEDGIAIAYAFKKNITLTWEEFAGIGFKGARAYASTTTGQNYNLPGVTFNSLPALSEASRGRIPDALTAGQNAADKKVVVIHRDGEQILLTKEEYEEYQRNNPTPTE